MATKTITFENEIAGVLTDLDAPPTLQDPTGTYGVRRADTLDVVAGFESGTVIPKTATGVYQLEITGLTAGVEYDYVIRDVFEGAETYTPGDFIVGATGLGFGSRVGMERIRGEIDVEIDADKDADGSDTAQVQADIAEALADANADIQLAWESRLWGLNVSPLTTLATLTIPTPQRRWLDRTASMGAVYYNAEGRGFEQDAGDDYAGKFFTLKKEYEKRLQQIRDGSVLMALDQTGEDFSKDVPGVVRPDGARVATSDLPRVCSTGPGYVQWPGRN